MTVNYTTNLSLGQPVTGTESGTWGDDVNNAVTSYLDIAIAGGLAVTVTTADVTLSITQGTSSATNIGSTTAQYAILNVSGAMTAARNLIVPSSSRIYLINNNTTGGFALTVKGSATSGVTLVNGEKAHVFWNGTDYAKMSNSSGGAGVFSSITNSGLTSGRVVFSTSGGLETDSAGLTFDGTTLSAAGLSDSGNLTFTGTGNRITGDFSNATLANRVAIQTSTVNGATTVNAIPNGTGTSSQFIAHNAADPDNAGRAGVNVSASIAYFFSDTSGTGTYVPIAFRTSGSTKLTIAADTTGTFTFGGTAPRITGDFSGASTARVMVQSSTVNGITSFGLLPNGTGASSTYTAFSNSDPTNSNGIQLNANLTANRIVGIANGSSSAVPITFGQGANEQMRIDTVANGSSVGIGYTTLTGVGSNGLAVLGKLGVGVSTINSGFTAQVNGDVGLGSPTRNQTTTARIGVRTSNDPSDDARSSVLFGTTAGAASSDSYIAFNTNQYGISAGERVRIDPAGNVGIGTSSPSQKLDVANTANAGASIRVNSSNAGSSTFGSLVFGNDVDSSVSSIQQNSSTNTTLGGGNSLNVFSKAGAMTFSTASTERMRIDSSGNVGIGTSSPGTKLTVSTGVAGNLAYFTDGINSDFYIKTASSITTIGPNAGSTNFAFQSSGTERMRIDSSGNVGIGLTNPSAALQVFRSGSTEASIKFNNGNASSGFVVGVSTAGEGLVYHVDNQPIRFATNNTERMRITSDGDLLLGITSAQTGIASDPAGTTLYSSAVKGVGVFVRSSGFPLYVNNKAASGGLVQFYCNGNTVGDISSNGTTTSYNITSDQRLKENIQDAESASTLIDALQVRQFDWKTDNTHQRYGFIAQELVTVAPEAVHQPTDPEEMMAVDYSKLVPMLVKEIQSLRKRLADAGIA